MDFSHRSPNLTSLLAATVALLLLVPSHTIAQDTRCTLSGSIVNAENNPIAGLTIAVQSVEISDKTLWPTYMLEELEATLVAYTNLPKSQTNETGQFSIAGIKPGPIQLLAQPAKTPENRRSLHDLNLDTDFGPDDEVLSIEIGEITFYPYHQEQPPFGGIVFAIEPGAHLENVVVTVKPRMRIRGQIVFIDKTPLTNAPVGIHVRQRDFDGWGTGNSGTVLQTDDAGYFVTYINEPGFYTVAAEFQGLSATSEQLILEAGQRHDGLALMFDSEPVPIEPTPDREEQDSTGQWILNPTNNHNYKRIYCESWEDAQSKAATEGAHLVSINDAAEQQWLIRTFGNDPYWIGLTDVTEQDTWSWTSGEPATYTNWAPHKLINADRDEEHYVFMGLSPDGGWHKVGPQSPEWRLPQMTILEREGLPAKPAADKK